MDIQSSRDSLYPTKSKNAKNNKKFDPFEKNLFSKILDNLNFCVYRKKNLIPLPFVILKYRNYIIYKNYFISLQFLFPLLLLYRFCIRLLIYQIYYFIHSGLQKT